MADKETQMLETGGETIIDASKTVNPTLFEQYKIMVATTSEVTKNRQTTNSFYVAVNTFLIAAMGLIKNLPQYGVILISITGMVVCTFWFMNIASYRNLNHAKFQVIHEMERELPVQMFSQEEAVYKKLRHIPFTKIECSAPFLIGIIYSVIIILQILQLVGLV
ncbi:hypothetical protein CUJ83_01240 [Methanocella sp. CWC-04]|uniref:Uncharacterized protein n=1 Tax=Methanooceanicella nereidis TaxID=2052831 RepID=A0AAP2W4U0_9EURY|nr:hypothetical protein [Methanocella sp. CWC-04]MCD1293622.1 hypothetical protein [Methanocella sp. CWC-04]